jgi:AraC-like DNA-binding protein
MDTRTILWVDLQTVPTAIDISADFGCLCSVYRIREADRLAESVRALLPCAIFFEYDEPRAELLEPLQWFTHDFPQVPVVMITQQHSEKLAVWALRARAWDYLVKPVDRSYLMSCVEFLINRNPAPISWRGWHEHAEDPSLETRISNIRGKLEQFRPASERPAEWETRLTPALVFVESNFAEKVTLGAAAKRCGLDRYQFSRAFKQTHGKTFREFIIIYRIQKAAQMMCFADMSITDVAFSVGFNDLSHFAQMFRRYMGMRPSDYVQGTKSTTAVHMTAAFVRAPGPAMQNSRSAYAKES